MKFCKRYEEYIRGRREKDLPALDLKKLKKILKRCRVELQSQPQCQEGGVDVKCLGSCAACDGIFFPFLLEEMSAAVGYFNQRVQELLEMHHASGLGSCLPGLQSKLLNIHVLSVICSYISCFGGKYQLNHESLMLESKDLVTYAIMNSIAVRKLLKKYDKIHFSKQGQAFKSQAFKMQIEILQSPWLSELMAFYINLRQTKVKNESVIVLSGDCLLTFDDDKPKLLCEPFDSIKIEIDLTCSICLETVFDPVSLRCGHIFCYMCCCSSASVTIIDGLKSADPKEKCPLCRQQGVYADAVHLDELSILLSRSCRNYWQRRLITERAERVRQAKEYWQHKCQAFVGI
ncbi:putative E3 ubiquitin-protein ligase BAH1-like 1 [Canna indica]|uniref:RING-type E3 ubiquitin transferase n=1 Tax=Canna indica TaxID=4628 RepID=A0AAQ3JWK7_9LILI|nr:putative E3 ubiquitin-protein ligase BAH1-like 1 [Canna indica]